MLQALDYIQCADFELKMGALVVGKSKIVRFCPFGLTTNPVS